MKSIISYLVFSGVIFLNFYNPENMPKDFCTCLSENDWACIKKEVNRYLDTVNKDNQENIIAEGFKQWLLTNACVKEVVIQPGMIETNPPIKQFLLKIETPNGITEKTIGIQMSKKILKAHIY